MSLLSGALAPKDEAGQAESDYVMANAQIPKKSKKAKLSAVDEDRLIDKRYEAMMNFKFDD